MAIVGSGEIVNILFYARGEVDGTYTLCIDVPQGAEQFPTEIAKGYATPADIVRVLVDALTAPAVAEERVALLEEYMPGMNATIDEVNLHGGELTKLEDRLAAIENWVAAMQASSPQARPATRPLIPRPGQVAAPPQALRRPVAPPQFLTGMTTVGPAQPAQPAAASVFRAEPEPATPVTDKPALIIQDRSEAEPHVPRARVMRGPGSGG